jgi:hypothetical protein
MVSVEIEKWIKNFFAVYDSFKYRKNNKKSIKVIKKHKNLNLNKQVIILFKNLICEIIQKIGKICGVYNKFKFNSKINQHHILKSFIEGNFLINAIWLFKYRKYFPEIFTKEIRYNQENT